MRYEIKGKKINIPDQEIEKSMKLLDITQEQAIELYLCDHDYVKNAEAEELTKKAKISGADKIINRKIVKKVGETARKPKENPLKEQIIADLHNFLLQNSDFVNIIVTNKTKEIEFYVNNKHFSLNLVEHRPPKADKASE